jgi:hypothetical protein
MHVLLCVESALAAAVATRDIVIRWVASMVLLL